MHLCGKGYKYFTPYCCKCNSFGCIVAIKWGNACHSSHSDSAYSGREHCQFNSPRLVTREAGFPNPWQALIGSNQLWRVNDSPYYRELDSSSWQLNLSTVQNDFSNFRPGWWQFCLMTGVKFNSIQSILVWLLQFSMVAAVSRALHELSEPCLGWTREARGQTKSPKARWQYSQATVNNVLPLMTCSPAFLTWPPPGYHADRLGPPKLLHNLVFFNIRVPIEGLPTGIFYRTGGPAQYGFHWSSTVFTSQGPRTSGFPHVCYPKAKIGLG